MSVSLYRKYRPQTFSEVIGQKHIVQTLSNAISNNHIGHAYLFTGPRGTGKTTLARIFAKAVNCENSSKNSDPCLKCDVCKNFSENKSLDIYEIDAASNTGVDNIRELRETVKLRPSQAKYKVYIIDEVHMLSTGAFNALLKTLEEPPAHVIFILATTEIHKVPQTIISRCQRFDFARLSLENIIEKLNSVAKSEGISVDKDALEMIAIAAEGGMRDAESLLTQVISLEDKKITAKEVAEILGTSNWQSLNEFSAFLLQKDATGAIKLVNQLVQDGYDLDVFHKSLLNFLRQLLLISVSKDLAKTFSYELTSEQTKKVIEIANGHSSKEILHILNCFSEIQGKIKSSFIPQLPIEMAIVKSISEPVEISRQTTSAPPTASKPHFSPTPTPTQVPKPKEIEAAPDTKFSNKPEEKVMQAAPETDSINAQVAAEFSITDIERNWGAICNEIKNQNHSLATIFPMCKPVSVEGNTVTIAAKYPFHKDKLKESQNLLTIEASFAKILGSLVRINAVTMEEAGIKIPETKPANQQQTEEKPRETSSLLTDAMGIMGGTIVE